MGKNLLTEIIDACAEDVEKKEKLKQQQEEDLVVTKHRVDLEKKLFKQFDNEVKNMFQETLTEKGFSQRSDSDDLIEYSYKDRFFIKLDFSKDTKKIIRTYNNQKIAKSFFYFNPKAERKEKEMITNKKTGKEIDEEYIKLIRTENYRFKLENCAESFDISKKTIMEIVNLFLKNSEE